MDLNKGLEIISSDNGLRDKLEHLYQDLPTGECKGCLGCCTESVNTFFVEYVHILRFLRNNPQVLEKHGDKISRFFLLEMMVSMYCPFVDEDGRCAIYPVRPLPCRIFGHLKEEDYDRNYAKVLASNEELAKYFEEMYNLHLPQTVIERKIPYCHDFISDGKMDIEERDDLVDLLFSMDSRFLMEECITFEDVNQSLITWFFKSVMPIEEAGEYRIKGMVYYENGQKDELEALIKEMSKRLLQLKGI